MFKNLFSWTDDSEYYYDDTRPEWNVDTAASQVIRYPQGSTTQIVNAPAVLVKHPDQVKPRPSPVPTPRIISVETPGHGHVERRIDHNQMQPAPMVRVQMPPALEYKVMEFRVPLCCEGCQDRVRKKLRYVRGVDRVDCDLHWKKVTVHGYAIPSEVLRALQKLFKRSDYWMQPVVIVQKTQGPPVIVEQRVGPVHGRH